VIRDHPSLNQAMRCLNCHTDNPPQAKFCRGCGIPQPRSCPHCQAVNRAEANFCFYCGFALLRSFGLTCVNCHAPLQPNATICYQCRTIVERCPSCSQQILPQNTQCMACNTLFERCSTCRAPNRYDAKFCRMCNQPFQRYLNQTRSNTLPMWLQQGRYHVQYRLGQGGMSFIYQAIDNETKQVIALKELNEQAIPHDQKAAVLEVFQREAELLKKLRHRNVLEGYGYFEELGKRYIVMELIDGETMFDILENQPQRLLAEKRVLTWAEQLCDAFSYLHAQQPPIIYRDMKPQNAMVIKNSDQVKLIDFGIVREYKHGKSQDTIKFGTPGYVSPEAYSGQTNERSDIYTLGVTLHQFLTGYDPTNMPFSFPKAQALNPLVSKQVSEAIAKAVEPEPTNRFATMVEFKKALIK